MDKITKNQSERRKDCQAQSATNTIFKMAATFILDQEGQPSLPEIIFSITRTKPSVEVEVLDTCSLSVFS